MLTRFEMVRNPVLRIGGIAGTYATTVLVCGGLAAYGTHALVGWIAGELSLDEARPADRFAFPVAATLLALDQAEPAIRLTFPTASALVPLFAKLDPASADGPSSPIVRAALSPGEIGPREDDGAAPWSSGSLQTYRTMCVRLCDGYFFPISFATSPEFFTNDEARCEASCASPARLYVFKNPGETPAAMESLDGRPYAKLETAYAYRVKYSASCTCKGQPWGEEARERHRVYALRAGGAASEGKEEEVASLESGLDVRSSQAPTSEGSFALERGPRWRSAAAIARFKIRMRPSNPAPRRRMASLPGIMRVGLAGGRSRSGGGSRAVFYVVPHRHGSSIGEMIRRSIGGF